jgi:peptidyl-tRNA hydrolase, PTH1 family
MILLVGLGNPGREYAGHRHNIGFMAVNAIADYHGFVSERARFQGMAREGFIDGPSGRSKALILRPTTYMNESGRSVGEAARFYKIEPEDIVVFHDELDLAAQKIRVKKGGGLAGHNGLKSIANHVGTTFRRVRLGIGHPGEKARVHGHVLGDFSKADRVWVDPLLESIARNAGLLATRDDASFMNKVTLDIAPPRQEKSKPSKDEG